MNKITQWSPKICKQISDEIISSLSEIEEKYGIKIKQQGGGKYDRNSSFTFKLNVSIVSPDGNVKSQEAEEFKHVACFYGLKPEYLHKEVFMNGEVYKVEGFSSRSRKYPVLTKRVRDGRNFKHTVDGVKHAFERKEINEAQTA